MVVIRLARGGAKKHPSYKIVVADSRKPRDGRFIESIGYYRVEPKDKPPMFEINMERYGHWHSMGAQVSPAVKKIVHLKARTLLSTEKEVVMEGGSGSKLSGVGEKPAGSAFSPTPSSQTADSVEKSDQDSAFGEATDDAEKEVVPVSTEQPS